MQLKAQKENQCFLTFKDQSLGLSASRIAWQKVHTHKIALSFITGLIICVWGCIRDSGEGAFTPPATTTSNCLL